MQEKEEEREERLQAAARVACGVPCVCATLEPDGTRVYINGNAAEICQLFVVAADTVGGLCQSPGMPEGLAGMVLAGVATGLLNPRGGAKVDAEAS